MPPMAATVHRSISSSRDFPTKSTALLTALFLMLTILPAAARPLSTRPAVTGNDSDNTSVSSTLTILVIMIVIAFVLLAIYIYIFRCIGDNSAVAPAMIDGIGGGRSRREVQKGLDSYLLDKFPTMVYSSVKAQKLGKESLECAVCLCELEDDDVLRSLPRCNHVYHRDCIDVWFATHVTCPVCRTNLAAEDQDQQPETVDVVSISVEEVVDGEDRHPDLEDLVRIGSLRREARSGPVNRVPMSSRSATDWESGERFRLRLPEDIRREIMAAGKLRRSASYAVFSWRGEGSSRRWYREGVGRGWRSLRLGISGRWPILERSSSARAPAVVAEGSVSGPAAVAPVVVGNGDGCSGFNLV